MIGPNYFVMNIHIYYKHFLIGQIADSTLSQIPNKISTKTLPFFKVTKPSDTLKELHQLSPRHREEFLDFKL